MLTKRVSITVLSADLPVVTEAYLKGLIASELSKITLPSVVLLTDTLDVSMIDLGEKDRVSVCFDMQADGVNLDMHVRRVRPETKRMITEIFENTLESSVFMIENLSIE